MRRNLLSLLGLLILVLIFAGSAILFLPIPFTRDQGIYAYVAWCWLGEWWPYQYAFEHKGPWLYLIYAIFLKLSRGAMWGPNLADLLSRMATVILLWILAKRMFNQKIAFLASLSASIPLLCVFSSCWWNAQAETFIMPLSVLSPLLVLEAVKSKNSGVQKFFCFIAGLVLSQMLMLKPSGLGLIAGLIIFLGIFSARKKKAILLLTLGLLAGLSLWIFYFRQRGIGREFYEEVILFNLFHLRGLRSPAKDLGLLLGGELWKTFGPGMILGMAGIYLGFKKAREPVYFLALIWFCAGWLELLAQARFFFYHLLILIPCSALILAIGFEGIAGKFQRVWKTLAVLIILVWGLDSARLYFLIQKHYQTWEYLKGKIDRGEYYARFQEPREGTRRDFNAYASWVAANRIRERTSDKDYVLIFGYEPGINYLSARRAPSRFHSDYPLDFPPKNQSAEKLRERWRKIFLSDLEQRKPKLVLLVHNDANALEPIDSYRQARQFPEFQDWLIRNYQPGERIEDFEFWWRIEE